MRSVGSFGAQHAQRRREKDEGHGRSELQRRLPRVSYGTIALRIGVVGGSLGCLVASATAAAQCAAAGVAKTPLRV